VEGTFGAPELDSGLAITILHQMAHLFLLWLLF